MLPSIDSLSALRLFLRGVPHSRAGSLVNLTIRLVLLPLFVVVELVVLPWRIVGDEPIGYQVLKDGRKPGRGAGDVKIYISRIKACWEHSPALAFQASVYIALLDFVALLGLQHVVRNFRPDIEALFAVFAGTIYRTKHGQEHASSPISSDCHHSLQGGHSLGQHTDLCPSRYAADVDCPCKASFLAACCKLAYEVQPIVQDVIRHRWGLTLLAYGNVPADLHKGWDYVPDMVYFVGASSSAVVITFAGAQPFNKIDRGTDVPTAMSEYKGCGRMTDGMVRGLRRKGPDGNSIFSALKSLVQTEFREIYLTGHSLGGALAVTFAQLLTAQSVMLGNRIKGIFTFGAPRTGDATCVDLLRRRFQGRLFRYVNASDMVCKLPHSFQGVRYEHHCGERFITSFNQPGSGHRVLKQEDDEALLADLERQEEVYAHLYSIAKLFWPPAQTRGCGFWARAFMLLLPGIADHFPAEYNAGLNELLKRPAEDASASGKLGAAAALGGKRSR